MKKLNKYEFSLLERLEKEVKNADFFKLYISFCIISRELERRLKECLK